VSDLALPRPGTAVPRLAATGAAVAALLLLLPVLLLAGSTAQQGAGGGGWAPDGIPPVYVGLYRAASAAFGVHWLLLASIHDQETAFSTLRAPGVRDGANGCGAAGPMQFGIVGLAPYRAGAASCGPLTGQGAGDTWRRYAHAADRLPAAVRSADYPLARDRLAGCDVVPTGTGCVYADADAVAAAAAYLQDLGAGERLDDRAWQAARAYNGSPAYADQVIDRARAWQAAARQDLALPDLPAVSGDRARLAVDGLARPPADAPAAVAGAISAANEISDRPYALVHFPTHLDNPSYDCSSSTSHVLWGAHAFGTGPWVSGQLMRYGEPGPGRWITVYASPSHAFVIVAGLRFDTARYDTGPNQNEPGPRWRLGDRPSDGFAIRHPPGL
jgi:hypothetical protein